MYVLHYAPDNASLIVRLALEEMGLPYRTALVDRAAKAQGSAAYRKLNPAGLIPVLETPHGPMFETAAILLWLADTHGQMAPPPDAAERGAFLKWLFFTSNTLHAMMRMTFYPEKFAGADPAAQQALRGHLQSPQEADTTLPRALAMLDARYADHPQSERPDILDYYVVTLLRWCALYPTGATQWFDLTQYPALHGLAQRLEGRDAVDAARAAEGLGPHPFTCPQPATPPEGSAT